MLMMPLLLSLSSSGAALPNAAPVSILDAASQPAPAPASSGPRLRDLTTDRPDTTESPYTVDAGHVQVETTVFGFARSSRDPAGLRNDSYELGTSNFRIGVTPSVELDIIVQPYGITLPGGGGARQTGIGALDLRAKLNLWGNDSGPTALALLPYVSIPLDRRNGIGPADTEFGLLVPLNLELGGRFSLGINAGVNVRRDEIGLPYRGYGVGTASLAVSWTDTIGSYFEVAVEAGSGTPASTSLNSGITWQIGDSLQLDAGTQFGVTGDAPIFAPFVGFSIRF